MPGDLHAAALEALLIQSPEAKCEAAHLLKRGLDAGDLAAGHSEPARELSEPGRPERPRLVAPRELPQRGLGSIEGRAAFLHAIAHIEFNAINLGLDAVYRFRGMPAAFYADWTTVAADEARHFRLLTDRLAELGAAYGDFEAHNGLWDMACRTADDVMVRMALVPRVLEARGLDVTPGMIQRLRQIGDEASARILETILEEEVAHVAAGSRWLEWCCEGRGLEPQATFLRLLQQRCPGAVRPPFNHAARLAAGFSETELERLHRTSPMSEIKTS
ncbi:MAG: ferritin-like domain-containing protein [Aquimonas sp.]|nr:ferritin-like domain-containing protein [Aquimonas sp.]